MLINRTLTRSNRDLNFAEKYYIGDIDKYTKNTVPLESFKTIKNSILTLPDNLEILSNFKDKIVEVINPEINTEKYYREIENIIYDDAINKMSGFTYSVIEDICAPIKQSTNDIILGQFTSVSGPIVNKNPNMQDMLNTSKNELQGLLNNTITLINNTTIYRHIGGIIGNMSEVVNSNLEVPNLEETINNLFTDGFSSISQNIQNSISQFSNSVNNVFNEGFFNNISGQLQNSINNLKGQLINNANRYIQQNINTITQKINENIGNVFCAPRITINDNGLNITPGNINLHNLNIAGYDFGGVLRGLSNGMLGSWTTDGGAGSVFTGANVATSIPGFNGIAGGGSYTTPGFGGAFGGPISGKSNSPIQPTIPNQGIGDIKSTIQNQARNNIPTNSTTTQNTSGSSAPKSPSVQNRNNNSNNSNSEENSNEPQEGQYDNDKPPRAKVKDDPRRDKTQELLLWETNKEKYVLLRDSTESLAIAI